MDECFSSKVFVMAWEKGEQELTPAQKIHAEQCHKCRAYLCVPHVVFRELEEKGRKLTSVQESHIKECARCQAYLQGARASRNLRLDEDGESGWLRKCFTAIGKLFKRT